MHHRIRIATALLAAGAVLGVVLDMGSTAASPEEVELDEAAVFIEWNSTDTDYGIQVFWDSEGFTKMRLRNEEGERVLDVKTKRNLKEQGLTEGFFESVEPPADEVSLDDFLDRFPEGDYEFEGRGMKGETLVGEAEFTHTLPAPPEGLYPEEDEEVSHEGFYAGFDPVTEDTEGNPIDIELYVLVFEKEDDDPILQTYEVILRPEVTEVWIPEGFLEPDTEYKLEVIAQEESGNRTITEVTGITTDADE